MTHGSLFSGIGGFDLAAEWMGWQNVFHCEWNDFGQKVLKHYWPKAISYHDITKTDFTIHRGRIEILTGGFPCQPYSMAGKRKGKEDERHLWPQMCRTIREVQPRWVVGENVYGLVNWSNGLVFHEVQADLEASGYEVFPYVLPAAAVNAPHRRDRVWFVAYNNGINGVGEKRKLVTQQKHRRFLSEIQGTLSEGLTPNSNRNGLNGSDCQHEEQPSEGGEYAQCDIEPMGWDVADTLCNGIGESRNRGQSEQFNKNGIEGGISADTDINGLEGNEQRWGRKKSNGVEKKIRRSHISNTKGEQTHYRPSDFQNFPTQSPICTGNDGLSARLDNITFSKWRNESIKAAGNAIVPQVALQIFKAIEQYEKQNPA